MSKSLKELIKRVFKQDIVKVFSLNSISTLVRMLTGLISVKIVASVIGPSGVALVGQLNNFTSILLGISNGGINSGITKYVAEFKDSEDKLKLILSNAARITLLCTLIVSGLLLLLHKPISKRIMLSDDYDYIFIIFGFTLFLYTFNAFLISVVNGFKRFKKYVIINITGTIVGLIFSVCLVTLFDLPGALISAVTYQSVVILATLYILRGEPWLNKEYYKDKLDKKTTRLFLSYSLMTIISLAVVPTSQMFLRGYVMSQISTVEAGWWEGMNRISGMYLSVITTSFGVYYLPRLSEIKEKHELRQEIFKAYKMIIPLLVIGFSLIYVLRFFIIKLLFTPEFYPMEQLFAWQMGGDLLKISSWLLAYQMVAKAMTKTFIATEIIFSFLYVSLGLLLVNINGIVGLTQGYFVNYGVYLLIMIFFFRKTILNKNKKECI